MQHANSHSGAGKTTGSSVMESSADIRAELLDVINEFRFYLGSVRQTSRFFPTLSKSSQKIIEQWETPLQKNDEFDLAPDFFSEGSVNSAVFILDSDNRFFKGESGELLVKILKAMNLGLDQVFICTTDNLSALNEKIDDGCPEMIITLGSKAGKTIAKTDQPLQAFRGRFFEYRGIPVMPTFHPSLLLKDPRYKRDVWEDMKQVMACMGLGS